MIGTGVSPECIQTARYKHPGLRFEVFDAYDLRATLRLNQSFTNIYIDASGLAGYRSLLDVIALLNMYATVLCPEAIILKSGALRNIATHCIAWNHTNGVVFGPGDRCSSLDQIQRRTSRLPITGPVVHRLWAKLNYDTIRLDRKRRISVDIPAV